MLSKWDVFQKIKRKKSEYIYIIYICRYIKNIIKHVKVKRIIEYDIPKDAITNTKKSNENRILNPDQMKLAKEIRKKCFPAYIDFTNDIIDTYQRALNCIKTNKPEPINPEIIDQKTFQYIWPKFLYRVDEGTKQLVLYIKSLPGFSQLDAKDLSALFDKHS